jgi:hypothetical protein
MAFSGEYMVEIEEAQKMERDLADMTKQRDALAEALTEIRAWGHHSTKERLRCFINKALAATKGVSHE